MQIQAEKREKLGKQSKKLKAERQIPAVVYGSGLESTPLAIDAVNFIKVYRQAGETGLIDLKFNDSNEKVLVKEVQLHPVTLAPIHASFFKVNLKEKIKANIPVEVIGEETSPVIKSGDGLVLVLTNEVEVEALPTDLPHAFTIDISKLENVGDAVTVADLEYDREKVEVVGLNPEDLVVKIENAVMAEEVEPELTEEEMIAGVEATKEKVEEDGEGDSDSSSSDAGSADNSKEE